MDEAAVGLVRMSAGANSTIQYRYDGGWQSEPFPLDRPFPGWHRGLGTTYHEAGTVWMGQAGSSVTDSVGRFHHIDNAYARDQSLFPTVGSANPVLAGLTLTRRVVDNLPA